MTKPTDLPVLPFATTADWEAWLIANHATARGLWIKYAKKPSGIPPVTYPQALDVALCHGWIDGQVARCDEQYYLQRFTPRRARSKWSKINRIKVKALIESGRMQPAGLREVGAAQRDGRWEAAYDSPSTATVPPDFAARLDASPTAARAFAGLKSMERYSMLYQLQDAKRPETRAKRIEKFMGVLEGPGVN